MVVDIIDYGAGNLASVTKAVAAVGATPRLVTTPEDLAGSRAILVPGVGHFAATRALHGDWHRSVRARLDAGAALLGICLGMQWLFEGSDEAPDVAGLGVFPGRCFRLRSADTHTDASTLKIPHVGWNALDRTTAPSRLLAAVPNGAYAYFTHTFAAPLGAETVASTTHGDTFASVVERDRIFGAQWHPEKSSDTGLQVLKTFVTIAEGGL
jgi:glutamine amidotransferase